MLVLCRIALQSLGGDSGTFKMLSGIDRLCRTCRSSDLLLHSVCPSLAPVSAVPSIRLSLSLSLSLGNRPGHRTLQLELPLHHH